MGSNTSKSGSSEAAVRKQKNHLDTDGHNSDPRSPTPEITRTPLQDKTGTKHNITKNVDLRKTFENTDSEEKLIHNNPILSAVIKNHLKSYDPRSPTQEFERTPIVISSNEVASDKRLLRIQSEHGSPCSRNVENDENYDSCAEAHESPDLVPKNLCNGFFDLSLNDTIKEIDEPLGSSTASNENIQSNISNASAGNPLQLLETNFDYVAYDPDKYEESKESIIINDDAYNIEQQMMNIPQFQILDDDPRSPSIGIDRTPIVVAQNVEVSNEGNVEEMSDDTLIKVLQGANAELRQTTKTRDNSEGLLIYQDESNGLNDTPKKSQSASSSGSRTPLSCMKNKTEAGHARSKSATHDPKAAALKASKRVSHIPRLKSLSRQVKINTTGSSVSLKNLSKNTAISGDCENTPPHSHRDRWDKDNSIVL